jgi:hypothetical protein
MGHHVAQARRLVEEPGQRKRGVKRNPGVPAQIDERKALLDKRAEQIVTISTQHAGIHDGAIYMLVCKECDDVAAGYCWSDRNETNLPTMLLQENGDSSSSSAINATTKIAEGISIVMRHTSAVCGSAFNLSQPVIVLFDATDNGR